MVEVNSQTVPALGTPVEPGYSGTTRTQPASPEEVAKVRELASELGGLQRLREIVNGIGFDGVK